MTYETAPATKMLATHCAVCNRPLVDAVSVNTGIGPECRKRSGYEMQCTDEVRQQANRLVYQIALRPQFPELAAALTELSMLGFTKLAGIIAERQASVTITEVDGRLLVKTPFTEGSLEAIRTIPGRRVEYDAGTKKFKGNSFPVSQKARVWTMLKAHFPGALGVGPKGTFTVPEIDYAAEAERHAVERRSEGCPHCGDYEWHDGEQCPKRGGR